MNVGKVLTFKIMASVTVPIRTMSFANDRFVCEAVGLSLRVHVAEAVSLCSFSVDAADRLRSCVDMFQ